MLMPGEKTRGKAVGRVVPGYLRQQPLSKTMCSSMIFAIYKSPACNRRGREPYDIIDS